MRDAHGPVASAAPRVWTKVRRCTPQGELHSVAWQGSPSGPVECKRDVARRYLGSRLAAAGRDHDELPAVDLVGGGRCVPGGGERRRPQQCPRGLVEGAELAVVVRRPDEYQAARGDERTSIVLAARGGRAVRRELAILAQRDLPDVTTGVQVDGAERAPGRRYRRVSIRVQESPVVHAVLLVHRGPHSPAPFLFDPHPLAPSPFRRGGIQGEGIRR